MSGVLALGFGIVAKPTVPQFQITVGTWDEALSRGYKQGTAGIITPNPTSVSWGGQVIEISSNALGFGSTTIEFSTAAPPGCAFLDVYVNSTLEITLLPSSGTKRWYIDGQTSATVSGNTYTIDLVFR